MKRKTAAITSTVIRSRGMLTPSARKLVLISSRPPSVIATMPPVVSTPWVTALRSTMNSTTAIRMRMIPAMLTGRSNIDTAASTPAITPITPGRNIPGCVTQKPMPISASRKRRYTRFGSATACRNWSKPLMS